MGEYQQTFTITNNSKYTLVLDTQGSSGLGDGNWPASISPNSTVDGIVQDGNFDVNPTAVYQCAEATPAINIYMHFFCTGVQPLVHVNMTMAFSSGPPFAGSSISEDNSYSDQTFQYPPTTPLSISTYDDGSTTGGAVFVVGSNNGVIP